MPAGAHSVKKPSQHSLIIITTFAYIFSVSGGSAAALKTIKNMTIRIPDGNAFRIRLTARNLITGEYTEAADLSNIDNLVINYVRRGIRFPHAYTIDEEGRATVADAGTLDCGFYGIELTGYYGGEKFRFYGKDLFEITTDTTDVIDPSNLIDIEITVKLNASGVSKDYVDYAINGMETSMETMRADLRDEIAEAGKVDDVKVNGVSVVSGKKADITVPTKVSDLNNDSGYQNATQVQQKVDDAKITLVDISVDGGTGTPSGSAGVSGNKLVIALHNIQGQKGDQGESIVGPRGPQGATSVYDQTSQQFLTTLETTTGNSQTKTMTQKAITDELRYGWQPLDREIQVVGALYSSGTKYKTDGISSNTASGFMAVSPGEVIRISRIAEDTMYRAAIVKNNSYSNNADIPFVDGVSEIVWKEETEIVVIPNDGAYIFMTTKTSGNNRTPKFDIEIMMKDKLGEVDEQISGMESNLAAMQEDVMDEFEKDRLWRIDEINLGALTLNSYNIYSDKTSSSYGKWVSGGAASNSCWVFQVTSGDEIKVVPQSGKRYEIAFLRTNNHSSGVLADFSGGEAPTTLRYTAENVFTVPEDATCMYVCKMFGSTNYSPSLIGIKKYTRDFIEELSEGVDTCREQVSQLGEDLSQSKIHKIEQIVLPSTASGDNLNYIHPTTLLWAGNTSYWSGLVMEVEPEATYKIVPQTGYLVRYAWLTANGRTAGQQPSFAYGCTVSTGAINETLYITAPSDAHYIYLNRNSESAYKAKQPSFFGKVIYINDAITELEGGASAVDKDTLLLVKHAAYKREGSDSASSLPYLNLLHYSDIHGSQLAATNILNAINAISPYLHGVINTGDVINAVIGGAYSGETFYPNSGLQEVSLFTLGNHDDLISVDSGTRKDKAWSHALYFTEEVIEALGITMPTGYDDSTSPNYNACYWHKDYADQKVRIIGLDCRNKFDGEVNPATGAIVTAGTNYTTNEQEEWLVARLAETLVGSGNSAAGYSVIVVGHYPLDNYDGDNTEWDDNAHKWVCNHKSTGGRVISQKTGEVTNWHRYTSTLMAAAASMRWSNASGHNNIAEIIKHYMTQAGSNFVAFLCGHTHNNLFFYPTDYPDILNICIDMAGGLRNMVYANQDTMGGYIANFLSFATSSKIVRIVRLGVKSDTLLTPIHYMTYDYANKKVIQEG